MYRPRKCRRSTLRRQRSLKRRRNITLIHSQELFFKKNLFMFCNARTSCRPEPFLCTHTLYFRRRIKTSKRQKLESAAMSTCRAPHNYTKQPRASVPPWPVATLTLSLSSCSKIRICRMQGCVTYRTALGLTVIPLSIVIKVHTP